MTKGGPSDHPGGLLLERGRRARDRERYRAGFQILALLTVVVAALGYLVKVPLSAVVTALAAAGTLFAVTELVFATAPPVEATGPQLRVLPGSVVRYELGPGPPSDTGLRQDEEDPGQRDDGEQEQGKQ